MAFPIGCTSELCGYDIGPYFFTKKVEPKTRCNGEALQHLVFFHAVPKIWHKSFFVA